MFELTDTCHLRLLQESDIDEVHALVEANRAYLSAWLPWAATQERSDTARFIESTRKQLRDNDGFQTAIVSDDLIVGLVGFHGVNWPNRATSLGYWLAERHQGKGIMTRAVARLTEHALGAWELNRLEIQVATDNPRSRAIPERLAFSEEGTLREAERVGGRYLDIVVYSLLARDWTSRSKAPAT